MDAPATKKAIGFFHDSIKKLGDLAYDFGNDEITPSDYLLLSRANLGLARAYGKVSTGVNPGDINFRLAMAATYLKSALKVAESSPLIKFSILNGASPSSSIDNGATSSNACLPK